MRAEYKRDVNHNYLILHGEQAVNTASYQVRMLVGNVIPSILSCRLQGLDGEVLFYYEITSRQSVASLYEQRKFGREDLKVLFGGFVQVMEEMGEYLLNPGYLVLQPEYMYLDAEKRQIGFCYLPGEEHEVKTQFRNLTEYVLPRLDHQDGEAVMLGYGVYRRALEDSFHLEHIKEELYQEKGREEMEDEEVRKLPGMEERHNPEEQRQQIPEGKAPENFFAEEHGQKKVKKGKSRKWGVLLSCVVCAGGLLALAACTMSGYLPRPGMEELLTGILVCLAGGLFASFISGKLKRKTAGEKREEWREKVLAGQKRWETEEKVIREREKKQESGPDLSREEKQGRFGDDSGKRKKDQECETGICRQGKENRTGMEPDKETAEKNARDILKLRDEIKREASKPEPWAGEVFGETVVLSSVQSGRVSLVSREPGELATIYLTEDLTVIGKLENASDAVIPMPTVSRIHAKIRRRDGEYYLTDLNSRNGTSVNGRMLKGDEEYLLQNEDEVDFAQARYVFLK